MKLLLTAIITLSLLSCKKDKSYCWHCDYGTTNGVEYPDKDYCYDNPDQEPALETDALGNVIQKSCTRK